MIFMTSPPLPNYRPKFLATMIRETRNQIGVAYIGPAFRKLLRYLPVQSEREWTVVVVVVVVIVIATEVLVVVVVVVIILIAIICNR